MHTFSVRCLGVGDGWPCEDRHHSAYLYQFPEASFLIDAGESVSGQLRSAAVDFNSIDRVFLSHLHCDHVGGFFMLMQGFWLEQRRKPLLIHLPRKARDSIRGLLNASCIFEELFPFRVRYESLKAGQPVPMGKIRVTPYATTHLTALEKRFHRKYPRTPFEAFCLLIERGRCRIGHSADIGAVEDLEPLVRKPLDLLVCEMAHCRPEDLFHFLKNRPIKKIVFVHLARPLWDHCSKTRKLASRMLDGANFHFAHNGEMIRLPLSD
jgi:ribonuclease Z